MHKNIKYIFILMLVLGGISAQSKEPYFPRKSDPVLEPWRWVDFPELDTIRVQCISRGTDDGLWMGIGTNVAYFDGYTLKYLNVDSTNIVSLAHEKDQTLLVATNKAIYRYQEGEFRPVFPQGTSYSRKFCTDENGYIWIGSDHGMINITPWYIRSISPVGCFDISPDGKVKNLVSAYSEEASHIKNLSEINFPVYLISPTHSTIYAACNYNGYSLFSAGNLQNIFSRPDWQFHKLSNISGGGISGLCQKGNALFVSTSDPNTAMQKIDLRNWSFERINFSSIGGDDMHTNMLETKDGTIWVSGHSKIYTYDENGWRLYQYPELKLPLSYIDLFIDKDDHLYVSGTFGMFRKFEYGNSSYTTFEGMNFQCNTPDGHYWFTSNKGEVIEADSTLTYFTKYNSDDGLMDMAMLVYYSRKGELWAAGSQNNRAAVARYDGYRWNAQTFSNLDFGISYNGVKELGDSAIAFSANCVLNFDQPNGGGFAEYNYTDKKWRLYKSPQVPIRIPSLQQTSDGKLWFSGGTVRVFDGQKTSEFNSAFNGANWTDDLFITSDDQIWVAQGGVGLFHYDGKNWHKYTIKDGLSSNMVTSLCYENNQSVFISTDAGISYYDGRQFVPHICHPNIGIAREKGILRMSANHNLWINTGSREWYLYDYKNKHENPEMFKTILYKRDHHGPQVSVTYAEKEIPPNGNVLIRFSGKDFWEKTPQDDLQFSYRLNQGEWSSFSSQKSTLLLNLKNGKYVFEVRARDRDQNISQQVATVVFIVQPPVFKRGWFILTILTFISIISWLLLRLYIRGKEIHEIDQFKLRLFTDISHELKTPLTLIMLPLQKLMEKESDNEASRQYIDLIHGNVERLSKLVNQVIDFRRLGAKKIQLDLSPEDVVRQLRAVYYYYKPLADEKEISFSFRNEISELWLDYDTDKLEKIVVNLLSNAFKYTPRGGKVEFTMNYLFDEKKLQLKVTDSGQGIPSNLQKNIFERFYRMKTAQINKVPGSGIGLSMVKELVDLHQGEIHVFSDGTNGTEFEIILPLSTSPLKPEIVYPEELPASVDENTEKPVVLLVEDEPQMLQFIAAELSVYFEVKAAASAEQGLELLQEMPDLVISDVMLPGMEGTEFCTLIKTSDSTCHIPVILLTARNSEENIIEGLSCGADDYMTKPFKMNELLARGLGLIENRKRMKKRFAENKTIKPENFTSHKGDQQFLDTAMKVVYKHLENPEFDVPLFCSETNTSKTLLYSKLKTLTGQSATEFVRNIRLKEAMEMLRSGSGLSVSEISYKVGFNDPLYFSRCFKKYFGIPPSEVSKEQ